MISLLRWFTKGTPVKVIVGVWRVKCVGALLLLGVAIGLTYVLCAAPTLIEYILSIALGQACYWTTMVCLFWLPYREVMQKDAKK